MSDDNNVHIEAPRRVTQTERYQADKVNALMVAAESTPAALLAGADPTKIPYEVLTDMLLPMRQATPPIQAWLHAYPHIKIGGIYRVADDATMQVLRPGDLCAIINIRIDDHSSIAAETPTSGPVVKVIKLDPEGRVMLLNKDTGKPRSLDAPISELVPVSDSERERIQDVWTALPPEAPTFRDGTVVRLKEDLNLVFEHPMMGTKTQFMSAGTIGTVDTPPVAEGANLNDANNATVTPPTVRIEFGWSLPNPTYELLKAPSVRDALNPSQARSLESATAARKYIIPSFQHHAIDVPVAGYGRQYKVYFSDLRATMEIDGSLLERAPFDPEALDKVILPEPIKRQLTVAASDHDVPEEWGLDTTITKGKGEVFLLMGPPGLGKTMSVEAVAQVMEKPMVIIDNQALGSTVEEFEKGLTESLETIKRWGGIGLWDDSDVFLCKRDGDLDSDSRIATALRLLENFNGILFLTSNRGDELDDAVLSRCQVKILYPEFGVEDRLRVLEVTRPAAFPIDGSWEETAATISKMPMSGRDIKSMFQNAARTAAAGGLPAVPAQFLIDEAQGICDVNDAMMTGFERVQDPVAQAIDRLGDRFKEGSATNS